MKVMEDKTTLAKRLADYGIHSAWDDPTPEQQDWGADCIESAIYLLMSDGYRDDYVLDFGFKKMYLAELCVKARQMREEAKRLRAGEENA